MAVVVVGGGGVDGGVVGGAAVGLSVVPPVVPSVVGGSVPEDGMTNCLTFSKRNRLGENAQKKLSC